jgi:hypothetical protein
MSEENRRQGTELRVFASYVREAGAYMMPVVGYSQIVQVNGPKAGI